MAKTIKITVRPDGMTTVTTSGFSGEECLAASRPLERALGLDGEAELTEEFYDPAVTERLTQGNGS
jgi:hypothetical protein